MGAKAIGVAHVAQLLANVDAFLCKARIRNDANEWCALSITSTRQKDVSLRTDAMVAAVSVHASADSADERILGALIDICNNRIVLFVNVDDLIV